MILLNPLAMPETYFDETARAVRLRMGAALKFPAGACTSPIIHELQLTPSSSLSIHVGNFLNTLPMKED
jgi:hypothetical protein